MDITKLFKAFVKTEHTKNKAFGISYEKPAIFPQSYEKSEFTIKLRELISQISRLRNLLLRHRKAYLDFAYVFTEIPPMTEEERDELDAGAERIIRNTNTVLCNLKLQWTESDYSPQLLEHQRIALELTRTYLKGAWDIYAELRMTRVNRAAAQQKISRLEQDSSITHCSTPISNEIRKPEFTDISRIEHLCDQSASTDESIEPYDVELSVQEFKLFQEENRQLYNDLNSLADEIHEVQSKVMHLAELQNVFTEKILQQEQDIELISTTLMGATENVREGNEGLHLLLKESAGLRAFVLFFFLLMSFSLMFVHWYND